METDEILYPSLNGTRHVKEGDGVIPSRPYSVRKSSIEKVSFAVAATAVPGVCVSDRIVVEGDLHWDGFQEQANRVYGTNGISPTIPNSHGGLPVINDRIVVAGDLRDPHKWRLVNVVLDVSGICTTLNANGGGGLVPKVDVSKENEDENIAQRIIDMSVAEEKENRIIIDGKMEQYKVESTKRVYKTNGIAPTCLARDYKDPIKIRDDGNDIIKAGELGGSDFFAAKTVYSTDGVAPTITTVHVGIGMPKIEVVGDTNDPTRFKSANRVYGTNGIAPTLPTAQGGGIIPKIETEYVKMNVRVRKFDVDTASLLQLLRTSKEKKNLTIREIAERTGVSENLAEHWFREDYFAIPVPEVWMELKSILGIETDQFDKSIMTYETRTGNYDMAERCYLDSGIAPTLTPNGNVKVKKKDSIPEMSEGDVIAMSNPGRINKSQNGSRFKEDGMFAITCQDIHGIVEMKPESKLRIRYLTPRETWRLQGFPDAAFDKAKDSGLSKTALYKLSGNSIAVPCLYHIFKKAFVDEDFKKIPQKTLEGFF